MKRWSMMLMGAALQWQSAPVVFAQPSLLAQTEIQFLLNFVEVSGCEFYRNGDWHDSVQAQEHLRKKFNYLNSRDRIQTAEDFIEMAATKSSISGQHYKVRCGSCTPRQASDWLTGALTRYRAVLARAQKS